MVRWARWCPNMYKVNHNGHAKNVVSKLCDNNIKKRYYCDICKTYFTFEQLKSVNSDINAAIKRRNKQRK